MKTIIRALTGSPAAIFFLLSGVTLSAAAPPVKSPDHWQLFRDPNGVFVFKSPEPVRMREMPPRLMTDGTAIPTRMFAFGGDTSDSLSCGVAVSDFASEHRALPESTPVTMAATIRSTLVSLGRKADVDQRIVLDHHAGWQIEMKGRVNGASFRLFVVNGNLYQALCTIPPKASAAQTAEVESFFNSFHLLR